MDLSLYDEDHAIYDETKKRSETTQVTEVKEFDNYDPETGPAKRPSTYPVIFSFPSTPLNLSTVVRG